MTYVEIKVSDPHMGDVKIDNGGKPDDSSLMTNPKNQITENIDEVVARVKAAYGIESPDITSIAREVWKEKFYRDQVAQSGGVVDLYAALTGVTPGEALDTLRSGA